MSESRVFYDFPDVPDMEIFEDHKVKCACCGGDTEDVTQELLSGFDKDYFDTVYMCDVCETRVAVIENDRIEVLAEEQRAEDSLYDTYDQYNWD